MKGWISNARWLRLPALSLAATALLAATAVPAAADHTADHVVTKDKWGGTLRIAVADSDLPMADIQQNGGWMPGQSLVGNQVYNGLTCWNFVGEEGRIPAGAPEPMPCHAESLEWGGEDNPLVWTAKIRPGQTFHDGTPIDADAVIFSFARMGIPGGEYDPVDSFEYYHPQVSLLSLIYGGGEIAGYRKIDDMTVEITTRRVTSWLPYNLAFLKIGSPTAIKKWGNDEFQFHPVGGGPFKVTEIKPRVSMTMERFEDYWGKVPNVDKVVLVPSPEAATRAAALAAGEVDWVEVPASDAIPSLEAQGFVLHKGSYPHILPYQIRQADGPYADIRLRKAINYAIDRETLCRDVMQNTCTPAKGAVPTTHKWFGNPKEIYNYDPEKSRQLLEEAGWTMADDGVRRKDGEPLRFKVIISTSGSGQMEPVKINEFIQRNLADVGIEMEIDAMGFNQFVQRTHGRKLEKGGKFTSGNFIFWGENEDYHGIQNSWGSVEPKAIEDMFCGEAPPLCHGNMGGYDNRLFDELIALAQRTFDPEDRDRLMRMAHDMAIEDSAYIFIVNDLNPKLMHPRVKGYYPEDSWFTSLQYLWIEE